MDGVKMALGSRGMKVNLHDNAQKKGRSGRALVHM